MMSEENRSPSFHAFIEQTARMLRMHVKKTSLKKRKFSKKAKVSNINKIAQIASLLRSRVKKNNHKKKKND